MADTDLVSLLSERERSQFAVLQGTDEHAILEYVTLRRGTFGDLLVVGGMAVGGLALGIAGARMLPESLRVRDVPAVPVAVGLIGIGVGAKLHCSLTCRAGLVAGGATMVAGGVLGR